MMPVAVSGVPHAGRRRAVEGSGRDSRAPPTITMNIYQHLLPGMGEHAGSRLTDWRERLLTSRCQHAIPKGPLTKWLTMGFIDHRSLLAPIIHAAT
jgi:hypothetical protein